MYVEKELRRIPSKGWAAIPRHQDYLDAEYRIDGDMLLHFRTREFFVGLQAWF